MTAISCRGLTKRWGTAVGIDSLDLDIEAGTVTGFLGPNGAGKSTTLKILAGLMRPTTGMALLNGTPSSDPAARSLLGYMPSDPAFYRSLTGIENLDLLASLHGGRTVDRLWAADLLELHERDLRRPVREYSSGMAQKLALVQAVQHRPEILMLDEPANRLDPLVHRRFEQMVRQIADGGRTVFLSSHTLSEVEDICDSVAMVRDARLLAHKPVSELSELAARRVRAVYRTAAPPVPAGLVNPQVDGNVLTAQVARSRLDVVRALLASEDLVDLTVVQASLEDAFVELYGASR